MKTKINQKDELGRYHGLWEDYYSDGKLGWKVHWHHGKLHGVWEWYRSDGTLCRREHWHHGIQKGLDTRWDPQGRCTQKRYYLAIR